MKKEKQQKHSTLKLILTTFFVTCLIFSNIIAGRQIQLPFNLVMPGAVIIFPITYILSDIFSEVYGYRWSRITNYMGIIGNLFIVLISFILISIPFPNYFENAEAYKIVLGNTPRMLIASMLGLFIGDLLNDLVFRELKIKHKDSHENYEFRAILSSLVGQLGDSFIFIPIAFYGKMPFRTMLIMITTQALMKVGYEILILPLSRKLMLLTSKYESEIKDE